MKQNLKSNIIPPAALEEDGWKFYEKCKCHNILKYKYINPKHRGLVLEWWVKYSQFKITYQESTTKIAITKLSLLEKTLKEL